MIGNDTLAAHTESLKRIRNPFGYRKAFPLSCIWIDDETDLHRWLHHPPYSENHQVAPYQMSCDPPGIDYNEKRKERV